MKRIQTILLGLLLCLLGAAGKGYGQEVSPVFQVFIEELGEFEEREVALFAVIQKKESGDLIWTSDPTISISEYKWEELLSKPDNLNLAIKTKARFGLVEFNLNIADIMPQSNWYTTQLEIKGLVKDQPENIFPFSASIVPVPLSVRSLSAERVSESAIRESLVVEEIQRHNDYSNRKNRENEERILELQNTNLELIESIERLKLDISKLQNQLIQNNYEPTIRLRNGNETELTLRPWEYIRATLVLPQHINEDEARIIHKDDVVLNPDDTFNLPDDAYTTYVVFSNQSEVVRVNLGQWENGNDRELTLQAGGIPGKAEVFIVRLDAWINYLNTDPESRTLPEAQKTFYVDLPPDGKKSDYPYVNSDPNGYTLDQERWGGAVDGNNSQSLFFGRASKYLDKIADNEGSEDFTYQYVIFATADSDASYVDGSQTNYVSAALQQIIKSHDPMQVEITPEEFYEQTSYGRSSLQPALASPLIVDLSSGSLLPEELEQEFEDSDSGDIEVMRASREGWKFSDLGFDFKKNHYKTHTKSVGIDIGTHDNWVTNGRPPIELKVRSVKKNGSKWIKTYENIENGYFQFAYLETLRLQAETSLINLHVSSENYLGDLGEMIIGDNDKWLDYRTFIEGLGEGSEIPNQGDETISLFDIVGKYQPVSDPADPAPPAPPNLNMYFQCRPNGLSDNRVIVFKTPLKLIFRTHNWGRSRLTELALKEMVNNQIDQAGVPSDTVDCQIWLFPAIVGNNNITNIVWATGGNFISAGSNNFGRANKFAALMIHEMGHNIQRFSDHYWAEKYSHSAAHQGRAVTYYDIMSKQSLFSDHILASKISRKWIAADKVSVFNPLLIESNNALGSSIVLTNKYKLANLNDLDIDNAFNNDPDLKGGLEIRLADGNNLTIEYRGSNTNGFKLNPYTTTWHLDGLDAESNYSYTTHMRNPPEHFKIFETWGNLGNGENTYAAVRSGAAQPPVLLAASDIDTLPTNLHTNGMSVDALKELSADEAWIRRSYPLLKGDGPFLFPSKPDQELVLDNISEDQLLEKLTVRPGNHFDAGSGELEVIYERYNRSDLVNSGADPSVLPQEQCCSWQSADIEIINAKSQNNDSWKNLPWPGHDNQIKVTIRNNTNIPAKNVRVQLSVMNYQVQAGSRRWAALGTKSIDLEANEQGALVWEPGETRGIFTVGDNHSDSQSYHKCIQAKILPWSGQIVLEGEVFVFEEQGPALSNNIAESNYTWKKSQAASPAEIVLIPVTLHNDYEDPLDVTLIAWPNNENFQVFNPEPSFRMEPFAAKIIEVGIQYSPRIDPNSKFPVKDGYVSLSAYAAGPSSDELGVVGGPHDNDILIGGALAKIFGGRKVNLVLDERSKTLSGTFFNPEGGPLSNGGMVSVYLGTQIDAQVLTSSLDDSGSFEFEGNEFTENILITLDPEESSEYGFFEEEFQPVQ